MVKAVLRLYLQPLAIAAVAAAGAWYLSGTLRTLCVLVAAWQVVKLFGVRWLLGRVRAGIEANLPDPLTLTPSAEEPADALLEQEMALVQLGLEAAGDRVSVNVSPPATLRAFVLPGTPIYATAFVAANGTASFDFVSVVAGRTGGVTTSTNPAAATLPTSPGALRQVFANATHATALAEHRKTVDALSAKGVRFETATAEQFPAVFKAAFARNRVAYRKNRLLWTVEALKRTRTREYPDQGSVLDRGAEVAEFRAVVG